MNLAPIAAAALEQFAPPDLNRVAQRIRAYLASELERVAEPDRVRVLGAIHDELAISLVEGGGGWGHLPTYRPLDFNGQTH